jgi:hypothetical protein
MILKHPVNFLVARPRVEPILYDALDLLRILDATHMFLEASIFSHFRLAHRNAEEAVGSQLPR